MKSINKQFIVKTKDFEPYIFQGDLITVLPISGNKTQVIIKNQFENTAQVEMLDVIQFCEEVA